MTAPAVWADATARITAAIAPGEPAPLGGLRCEWPNVAFKPAPQETWLSVESYGVGMRPIEMGRAGAWQQDDEIVVTVVVPFGTGVEASQAIAEAISNLFRNATAEGSPILYHRQIVDFGQKSGDGKWWETPIMIGCRYTDRPA